MPAAGLFTHSTIHYAVRMRRLRQDFVGADVLSPNRRAGMDGGRGGGIIKIVLTGTVCTTVFPMDEVAIAGGEIMTVPTTGLERLKTNFLGGIAVYKVIIRAIEKGWALSQPVVECRYDLILDDGFKLWRAQIKYAGAKPRPHVQGMVGVGLSRWRSDGRPVLWHYAASEIDALLVYVRAIDQILWFGPEVFDGRSKLHIRIEPTRNGQKKGCLMAADYVW